MIMGLTNAERQKLWRERHKDHVRVPVKVRSELDTAQAEIATLRARVAELECTPHRLRLLAVIPAGEPLMGVELKLFRLCRADPDWLAALVALADACGPATFIEALRRFDPVAHKKAQQRMARIIPGSNAKRVPHLRPGASRRRKW
jgi:hypothetical protein